MRGGGERVAAGPAAPGTRQRPAEGERKRERRRERAEGGERRSAAGRGTDPAARPRLGRGRRGGPGRAVLWRPVPGLGAWAAAGRGDGVCVCVCVKAVGRGRAAGDVNPRERRHLGRRDVPGTGPFGRTKLSASP